MFEPVLTFWNKVGNLLGTNVWRTKYMNVGKVMQNVWKGMTIAWTNWKLLKTNRKGQDTCRNVGEGMTMFENVEQNMKIVWQM